MNNFIVSLLSKVELSNERVLEVLNSVAGDTDDILRLMAYISGAEDKPVLPAKIENDEMKVTFVSYDIVADSVSYTGLTIDTIYLASSDDAAALEGKVAGEDFDLNKITHRGYRSDSHPYPAKIWRSTNSTMRRETWITRSTK